MTAPQKQKSDLFIATKPRAVPISGTSSPFCFAGPSTAAQVPPSGLRQAPSEETVSNNYLFVYFCFYFQYSEMWVIEDPAVIYVRECFAYVLL